MIGPVPGQPGHLADHAAIESELQALDVPSFTASDLPPERIPLLPPWADYGTTGEYQPLQIARCNGMAVLFGIAQAKSATAGTSQIGTVPEWAIPEDGRVLLASLSNGNIRLNIQEDGSIWTEAAVVANAWYAPSTAWRVPYTP